MCDKTAFVSWRSGRSVGDSCGGIRLSVFARALLACGVLACGILGGIFADGYRPGDGISTAERKRTAFGAGVFLLMFALGSGRYLEAEKSRQAYLGELQDGMYVTVQGRLRENRYRKIDMSMN